METTHVRIFSTTDDDDDDDDDDDGYDSNVEIQKLSTQAQIRRHHLCHILSW